MPMIIESWLRGRRFRSPVATCIAVMGLVLWMFGGLLVAAACLLDLAFRIKAVLVGSVFTFVLVGSVRLMCLSSQPMDRTIQVSESAFLERTKTLITFNMSLSPSASLHGKSANVQEEKGQEYNDHIEEGMIEVTGSSTQQISNSSNSLARVGLNIKQRVHWPKKTSGEFYLANSMPIDTVVTSTLNGMDDCSICLSKYEEAEKVSKTACGHYYHHCCIVNWMRQSNNCPLCKTLFTPSCEN